MRVTMLGLDHRTAPVEVREKLALDSGRIESLLAAMRSRWQVSEALVLCTCNRTEVYLVRAVHRPPGFEDLAALLAEQAGLDPATLRGVAIHREQIQAMTHLFRVAGGLESMVLGEPQILGQIKRAYEQAQQMESVGPILHKVFQQAIAVGKKIRTETAINEGRMSVGSVTVDFARRIFEDFRDKIVVGVGAGEMAKLALRHLRALEPLRLWVANRSLENAQGLCQFLGIKEGRGGPRAFADLEELLVEADIVVSSVASPQPIITAGLFKHLLRRRRGRPLFLIDLAVPRNVEPAVGSMTNVFLYNIDDLQSVVQRTVEDRSAEMIRCDQLLRQAAELCAHEIEHRYVGELAKALRTRLFAMAEMERDRTLHKLAAKADGPTANLFTQALDEHTHRLLNKILHLPLSQLDRKDTHTPLAFYAAALRKLFDLGDEEIPASPSPAPSDQTTQDQAEQ
ncbi:MAG: glutamyl-tRNA reductase [Phycisphaeraceae bacterium]|nr:glutamyl-tRNA reductase [Phycisphaeraceae bacterium]